MIALREKNITPEKAAILLRQENIEVDLEEAAAIVKLLYLLAEIYLNEGREI
jgi:hypothetical protein